MTYASTANLLSSAKPVRWPWDGAALQPDALLKAAFPDAQKVRSIGPEDVSDTRKLNKRVAFKKADGKVHYHKDYAMDKATGRPKGYADPQGTGHGKYPHINIRRPDGKQIRIDIIGK